MNSTPNNNASASTASNTGNNSMSVDGSTFTTPTGGVGGLAGQQQQPAANTKPAAGTQKGVAATATIVPPTGDMGDASKIDPYEAVNISTAAFQNERKIREALELELSKLKKEKSEKDQAEQAAAKVLADKAEEEKKAEFIKRKQQMAGILNQAIEQMKNESGGLLSDADMNGAKAPLLAMTQNAQTQADLDNVQKNIGPVIEFAMKACSGARAIEEKNKQRELAANMQMLNSALSVPPPSNLAISGNYNSWQAPSQAAAAAAETTTHKASANFFDKFNNSAQPSRAPLGAAGVASTPAKPDATTPAEVDLNSPGWGMQLIEEFQQHSAGWLPSEQYLRHGGIERVQRIVNANGVQHIQTIPQPRRAQHQFKGRITMADIDKEGFEALRDGINQKLHYSNRPAVKSIAVMQTPETDYRKVLVPYKPEATDEGVTSY